MALTFKLEIASPKTRTGAAKTWTFSPESSDALGKAVQSIEVELKKDKHRLSMLSAKIHDPAWQSKPLDSLFNALPDPAFTNVPVRLYLAPPGAPRSPTVLVFDGVLWKLEPAFPAPTFLTITAQDKSLAARKQAKLRTFRNKTSTQIAEAIAKEYGWTVDVDAGTVTPKARTIDFGIGGSLNQGRLSDWDHLARALHADGLEAYMHGSTLRIRQIAKGTYKRTFSHGDDDVLSFVPQIEHVHGPGAGGDVKSAAALDTNGAQTAALADPATATNSPAAKAGAEAAGEAANASLKTHRNAIGGPSTNQTATHLEDVPKTWSNAATQLARRKDTASLQLLLTADLSLDEIVNVSGYGGKCDGPWHSESIKHRIVSAGEYGSTTVSLHRAASKSGAASGGVTPALGSGST